MRQSTLKTTIFILISILSLLGQGLAFAPTIFAFILRMLPAWGNLTFGLGLFLICLIALGVMIHLWDLGSFTNWTLFAIQAVTVFGMYLLLEGFASPLPETCFLFTGTLTALTIAGIFINNSPAPIKLETSISSEELVAIETFEEQP